jgi:hypothetical protein
LAEIGAARSSRAFELRFSSGGRSEAESASAADVLQDGRVGARWRFVPEEVGFRSRADWRRMIGMTAASVGSRRREVRIGTPHFVRRTLDWTVQQVADPLLQDAIGWRPNSVVEPFAFKMLMRFGIGEAGVGNRMGLRRRRPLLGVRPRRKRAARRRPFLVAPTYLALFPALTRPASSPPAARFRSARRRAAVAAHSTPRPSGRESACRASPRRCAAWSSQPPCQPE